MLIKNYIFNNLQKTILRLKNNYFDVQEVHIPKNWKIDDNTQNEFIKIMRDNSILENYNNIDESNFTYIIDIVKESTNFLKKLKGSIISNINYKLSAYIHHYIFIVILKQILKNEEIQEEKNKLLVVDASKKEGQDYEYQDIEDIDLDVDITKKLEQNENIIIKILVNILYSIENNDKFYNKYSNKNIQNTIEKKNENDKESNLKFIQDLDRETWSSLKTMISLGMDTWKNLSNKNMSLYVPTNEPNEDITLTEQETNDDLRMRAQQELGSNFSEESFNDWRTSNEQNSKEDKLAYEERDIMSDDDE